MWCNVYIIALYFDFFVLRGIVSYCSEFYKCLGYFVNLNRVSTPDRFQDITTCPSLCLLAQTTLAFLYVRNRLFSSTAFGMSQSSIHTARMINKWGQRETSNDQTTYERQLLKMFLTRIPSPLLHESIQPPFKGFNRVCLSYIILSLFHSSTTLLVEKFLPISFLWLTSLVRVTACYQFLARVLKSWSPLFIPLAHLRITWFPPVYTITSAVLSTPPYAPLPLLPSISSYLFFPPGFLHFLLLFPVSPQSLSSSLSL